MSLKEIFSKIKDQDPEMLDRWKQHLHIQLVCEIWLIDYRTVVDQYG